MIYFGPLTGPLNRYQVQVPGKPASLFSDINLMIIVVVLSCTIVCVGHYIGGWEVLFGAGGLAGFEQVVY
jgi:hypothetical protein